ncbi:phosphate ABC transporter substrate-binding protein [Desulfovibrionales bacterium]
MKRFLYCALVIFAGLMIHCTAWADMLEGFAGQKGKIDIAGGTAHIPVMTDAAKRIMAVNPDIRITIEGGGTGVGVQKAGEGLADIGNTGRALSEEEIAKYGLVSFAFAVDGVTLVLHPSNNVSELSADKVREIFAGTITNWKDVGGADAPITLYARDEASGTREVFWGKLLKKGLVADSANIVSSNGAMKVAVSNDVNAIGYMSIGFVDAAVKAPLLDGVEPSQDNAKDGTYPVVRKLFMNTKGEPQGLAKLFVEYVTSPACADIISKAGYIPLN